jgi:hypothetical protein
MIDALHAELGRVGIRGGLRRRILAELADHLACDPGAQLGEPSELARQFADELGTSRSRSAAFGAFAALGLAGGLFTASYVAVNVVAPPVDEPRTAWLGGLAVLLVVAAPQVSFAAGSLALLRAFRRRRVPALSAAEVQVIRRRAGIALAFGVATMCGISLFAYEYTALLPAWLRLLSYASAAAGAAALGAAAVPLVSAARVRVSGEGVAGDIFDDLGPLVPGRLRGHAWRLALLVAGAVALAVALAGVVQSDPIDGAARGLAEGLACLAGFAGLGRFLGLRAGAS